MSRSDAARYIRRPRRGFSNAEFLPMAARVTIPPSLRQLSSHGRQTSVAGFILPRAAGFILPRLAGFILPRVAGFILPRLAGFILPRVAGFILPRCRPLDSGPG